MKYSVSTFILLLNFCFVKAQDTIVTKDKIQLLCKVVEVGGELIKYKKIENIDGPSYTIDKSEVIEVHYNNGFVEKYSQKGYNETSLEKIKQLVVQLINDFGYEEHSERRCRASFEGDYLRLVVLNKAGTDKVNDGLRYDFSTVYDFQKISFREDDIAYINIFIQTVRVYHHKRDYFEKLKLIMQVKGHENAEAIVTALQDLNKLLKEKKALSKESEKTSR